MKLNKDDYEIYQEYLEEEIDAYCLNEKALLRHKLKAKIIGTIVIVDRNGEYEGYFDQDEIYDFHGSSLFVVDESQKLAYFSVEPRDYNSLEELQLSVWGNDLTEESIENIRKYKPTYIFSVE